MILINVWETRDARAEAAHFAGIWGVDGTVLVDEAGSYAQALDIRGVPTNVLVDDRGTVREVGATTPGDLQAAVEALLAED